MREAIVTLTDEEIAELGFRDLVDLCREAGIRDVEMLEDHGDTCLPQIEVEERIDGDELDTIDCVESWDLVAETDETSLYIMELTATELPEGASDDHDDLVRTCEPTLSDRGLLLSLVGPQEAIREMLRNFEAAGASPDIHKLGDYEGQEAPLDALTNRQREVIETAYRMGFYDVPREATTDDVASELGIDSATLSEHLQRAERNLLTSQLAT